MTRESRGTMANRLPLTNEWGRFLRVTPQIRSTPTENSEPAEFRQAVAAMNAAAVRPEIELGVIPPPRRLAPYSYALGAEVKLPEFDIAPERPVATAFGRLILLYDPQGCEAWDGTMRLVAYIQADLDTDEAVDALTPELAWSWLVDALQSRAEYMTALRGTVTATTSVSHGEDSGPPRAHQLELRASWTATTPEIGTHVEAFCEVLERAAGLPAVLRVVGGAYGPGSRLGRLTSLTGNGFERREKSWPRPVSRPKPQAHA